MKKKGDEKKKTRKNIISLVNKNIIICDLKRFMQRFLEAFELKYSFSFANITRKIR